LDVGEAYGHGIEREIKMLRGSLLFLEAPLHVTTFGTSVNDEGSRDRFLCLPHHNALFHGLCFTSHVSSGLSSIKVSLRSFMESGIARLDSKLAKRN